jgi:acyl carrier protein
VFTTTHPNDGSDLICIAAVFKKTDTPLSEQYNLTRTHLAKTFAIQVDYMIPVRANQIPKTSSGKLQRHTLREQFDNGDFVDLIDKQPVELDSLSVPAAPEPRSDPKIETNQGPGENSAKLAKLQDLVKETWIAVLKVEPQRVTLTEQFSNLGGTSLQAAEVHATLEDRLGDYISHEMLSESDTVEAMADYIYKEYPELLKNIA